MMAERVQSVASMAKDMIPEEFIRSEKERPSTTTFCGPAPEIPTIDLGCPDSDRMVREVAEAASKWGVFQVINHGIPLEVIQRLQKVGNDFFQLPVEEKEAYARNPGSGSPEGYGSQLHKDPEGKKTWVDFLFHTVWPSSRINYHAWPKNPPDYREANEEYVENLHGVVDRVLTNLSLGLGLEGGKLKEAVGGEDFEYLLKINYYPPCPRPDLALGLVAHTDISAVTILLPNEVPGLQISKDDQWFEAKCIPNALIVVIGDQVEILSNGQYKSVLHRTTLNKDLARMSWPVFCCPPGAVVLGPLPKLVSEENPAKFKTKMYKDYLHCKLNKLPQ